MYVEKGQNQLHDSVLLMILCARCSYVVFGLYDNDREKKSQGDEKLTEMQVANKLESKPNLMSFMTFALYSPNLFFG